MNPPDYKYGRFEHEAASKLDNRVDKLFSRGIRTRILHVEISSVPRNRAGGKFEKMNDWETRCEFDMPEEDWKRLKLRNVFFI